MLPQQTFIVVKIPIWIYVEITDVNVDIFVLKMYALEYPANPNPIPSGEQAQEL